MIGSAPTAFKKLKKGKDRYLSMQIIILEPNGESKPTPDYEKEELNAWYTIQLKNVDT